MCWNHPMRMPNLSVLRWVLSGTSCYLILAATLPPTAEVAFIDGLLQQFEEQLNSFQPPEVLLAIWVPHPGRDLVSFWFPLVSLEALVPFCVLLVSRSREKHRETESTQRQGINGTPSGTRRKPNLARGGPVGSPNPQVPPKALSIND
jgi:hypothetical protein